jgi:HAD superfamily hydrolase (TIGR01509 family)
MGPILLARAHARVVRTTRSPSGKVLIGAAGFADAGPLGRVDPRGMAVAALGEAWWAAFDAADSAVHAAAATLPAAELRERAGRLLREREATVELLDAVARVEHDPHRFAHLLVARSGLKRLLGLPAGIDACVFNLDGVLVGSAAVHAAAWQEVFDRFLEERSERTHGRFAPFDPQRDYPAHLHGRPRREGVHAFLASRGISLPPPEVHALAEAKQAALARRLAQHSLHAFVGSEHYLELAREAGVRRAVVSASANASAMLAQVGLDRFVDVRVDGTTMAAERLRAKPAPDVLLAACERLAVAPERAAAFETTPAGVAAARRGGFAYVVAVDMPVDGADRGVSGLAELLELSARPGSSTAPGGRRARTPSRAT